MNDLIRNMNDLNINHFYIKEYLLYNLHHVINPLVRTFFFPAFFVT